MNKRQRRANLADCERDCLEKIGSGADPVRPCPDQVLDTLRMLGLVEPVFRLWMPVEHQLVSYRLTLLGWRILRDAAD